MEELKYDLKERTYPFAFRVRRFIKTIPLTMTQQEDGRQLVRSSGSIAANSIEANEALSKKDFLMRIKNCRKEAKESILWLKRLFLDETNDSSRIRSELTKEASELTKIFWSDCNKN